MATPHGAASEADNSTGTVATVSMAPVQATPPPSDAHIEASEQASVASEGQLGDGDVAGIQSAWGDDVASFLDRQPMNDFGARPRVKAETMGDRDVKRLYYVCMTALVVYVLLGIDQIGFAWQWDCQDVCGNVCRAQDGDLRFDADFECATTPYTDVRRANDTRSFYDPQRGASRWLFSVDVDTWNFDAYFALSLPKPPVQPTDTQVRVPANATITILRISEAALHASDQSLLAAGDDFMLPSGPHRTTDKFVQLSRDELRYATSPSFTRSWEGNETLTPGALLLQYLVDRNVSVDADDAWYLHDEARLDEKCDVSEVYSWLSPEDDSIPPMAMTHCIYDRLRRVHIGGSEGLWLVHVSVISDVAEEVEDDDEFPPLLLNADSWRNPFTSLVGDNDTAAYLSTVHHPRLVVMFEAKEYKIAEAIIRMIFLLFALFVAPQFVWRNTFQTKKNWGTSSPEQVWAGASVLCLVLYINPAFIATVYMRDQYGTGHADSTGPLILQVLERAPPVMFFVTFLCFLIIIPFNVAFGHIRALWVRCCGNHAVNLPSLLLACLAATSIAFATVRYIRSSEADAITTSRLIVYILIAYGVGGVIAVVALVIAARRLSRQIYTAARFERISLRLYFRLFVPAWVFVVSVQSYEQANPHALSHVTTTYTDLSLLFVACIFSLVFAVLYTPLRFSFTYAPPPPHTQMWLNFKWTRDHYVWWHHYGASLYFFITEVEERKFDATRTGATAPALPHAHNLPAVVSPRRSASARACATAAGSDSLGKTLTTHQYDPEHHFESGMIARQNTALSTGRGWRRSASLAKTKASTASISHLPVTSAALEKSPTPSLPPSPRTDPASDPDYPPASAPQLSNDTNDVLVSPRQHRRSLTAGFNPSASVATWASRIASCELAGTGTRDGDSQSRSLSRVRSLDFDGILASTKVTPAVAKGHRYLTADGSGGLWPSVPQRRKQSLRTDSWDPLLNTLRQSPGPRQWAAHSERVPEAGRRRTVAIEVPEAVHDVVVAPQSTALPSENPYVQALERGGKILKRFQSRIVRQWSRSVQGKLKGDEKTNAEGTNAEGTNADGTNAEETNAREANADEINVEVDVDEGTKDSGNASKNVLPAVQMFCLETAVECLNMAWLVYMYNCEDGADWLLDQGDVSTVSTPTTASTCDSSEFDFGVQGVNKTAELRWYSDFTRVPLEFRHRGDLAGFKAGEWYMQGVLQAQVDVCDQGVQWICAWLPGGIRQDILRSASTSEVLARREESQAWAGAWGLPGEVSSAWRTVLCLLDNSAAGPGFDSAALRRILTSIARVFRPITQCARPRLWLPFELEELKDASMVLAVLAYLKGQVWVMANLPEAAPPASTIDKDDASSSSPSPSFRADDSYDMLEIAGVAMAKSFVRPGVAAPATEQVWQTDASAAEAAVVAATAAAVAVGIEGCAAAHLPVLFHRFAEEVLSYVTTGDYLRGRHATTVADPYREGVLQPFKVPDVASWAASHFQCSGHDVVEGLDLLRKAGYLTPHAQPKVDVEASPEDEERKIQDALGISTGMPQRSSMKPPRVPPMTEPDAPAGGEDVWAPKDGEELPYTVRKCFKTGRDGVMRENVYLDLAAVGDDGDDASTATSATSFADPDGGPVGPPVRMSFDGTLWEVVYATLQATTYGPTGVKEKEKDVENSPLGREDGLGPPARAQVPLLGPVTLRDDPVYNPYAYVQDRSAPPAHGAAASQAFDFEATLQQLEASSPLRTGGGDDVSEGSDATVLINARESTGAESPRSHDTAYHMWGQGRLAEVLRVVRGLVDPREWTALEVKPEFVGGYERVHCEYYGYSLQAVVTADELDLRALLFTSPSRVILAFRGTVVSEQNVNLDMDTRTNTLDTYHTREGFYARTMRFSSAAKKQKWTHPVDWCGQMCFETNTPEIHQGFLTAWETLQPAVCTALLAVAPVSDTRPLYTTGHSLGGALAQLAAYHLTWKLYKFQKTVKVYSYGAPKVGNAAWARAYDHVVPSTFRVDGAHDPVPSMPPSIGANRYLQAGTNVTLLPDAGGGWVMNPTWLDLPMSLPDPTAHSLRQVALYLRNIQRHFGVTNGNAPLCPLGEEYKGPDYEDGQTEASMKHSRYCWPWVRIMPPEVPGGDDLPMDSSLSARSPLSASPRCAPLCQGDT
eukprot:TRINITY_DN5167_c0_g2_i1.p1 TRINITY_DN5167_c0_g2~~TRINITY_DN5167_c0_g2_i1.p1  ORF type:complete len:2151 (+),score=409.39 TRINITY_DN5167_c0_g2_i1:114-6566(+)